MVMIHTIIRYRSIALYGRGSDHWRNATLARQIQRTDMSQCLVRDSVCLTQAVLKLVDEDLWLLCIPRP